MAAQSGRGSNSRGPQKGGAGKRSGAPSGGRKGAPASRSNAKGRGAPASGSRGGSAPGSRSGSAGSRSGSSSGGRSGPGSGSRSGGPQGGRGGAPAGGRGGPKGGAPRGAKRAPKGRATPGAGIAGNQARKQTGLGGEQIEGRHAVREVLIAGRRKVSEILMATEMDQADILDDIVEIAQAERVPIREVSRRRLDAESFTMSSQGVIAFAKPLEAVTLESLCKTSDDGTHPFLLVLDGITDPGNLGALIRTAEGAGVTGIVLPKHRAVHVTATVAKASAGAVEYVPMALVGGLPTALADLAKHGVWTVGFDGSADRTLHELPIRNQPVAVVLGAEGEGISRLVRERCDEVVSIPMAGNMESLNVSNAGALALYEIVRARQL